MNDTRTSLLRRVSSLADQESWGEFTALYEPLLLSYVCKQGLTESDARDVVQDIFVKLLQKLPTFALDRSRGRFRTWLWQISHNAMIDYLRKKKRLERAEEQRRSRSQEAEAEPEDEWVRMHKERILQFALDKVRKETVPKSWACFEEHILKRRSGADVGAELGLPPNSVYVNASRVLTRVRTHCALYEEELNDD